MELQIMKRGVEFSRRKKKWLIILGLVGVSSYGAYKVYNMPSVVRKRKRIMKLLGAIISMAEMVSDSALTFSVVTRDMKEFLESDSDQIPNSLKQLSKISRSEEFAQSVIKLTEAMTIGVFRGYQTENRDEIEEMEGKSSFSDKVMDKMMSSAGTGFVSVVVGSFAKNLVMGFYANRESNNENSSDSDFPKWVDVICNEKCKVLIADSIQTFVSTAIGVYLDKTMDINFYDDMFSGMTNPKHQTKVIDLLASLCNGAVETLVKTSYQVLTTSKSSTSSSTSSSSCSITDENEGLNTTNDQVLSGKRTSKYKDAQSNGLVSDNVMFMFGLSRRVTFDSIKTVLEFFWRKIIEYLKSGFNVVHDEVMLRGLEMVRYVGAKSSVIVTICFALILHVLGSTQLMLPA